MSDSVRPHRRKPTRLPRPWDSPGKNTGVGCHFLLQCMKVKSEKEVAQSCPTLSDPMDYSLPGSSIHGIFQARVLEWGAIAFSDMYAYICLIHIVVQQKLTQHCKAIIVQKQPKQKTNQKNSGAINITRSICADVQVFFQGNSLRRLCISSSLLDNANLFYKNL